VGTESSDQTTTREQRTAVDPATGPAEGAPAGPDQDDRTGPSDGTRAPSAWSYVVRRTWREFSDDQGMDLAAALTYRSVMAIFPAAIVLLSLLGLFGQGQATIDAVTRVVTQVGGGTLATAIEPIISSVSRSGGAGLTFAAGIVVGLYSASSYVAAFGRAMNRIYEVEEGRAFWTLRPVMLLVTLVTVVLAGLAALILALSGGVARAVGQAVGLGDTTVRIWDVAKWPVLLVIVVVTVAVLYWATPNVRQPRFRIVSVGAAVAILIWVLASVGFGFYVANFGSYNRTYGSLAGAIIFLLWLWLTNVALLLGAELDAELERVRELRDGIPAETAIQLPTRGTRTYAARQKKTEALLAGARALRREAD